MRVTCRNVGIAAAGAITLGAGWADASDGLRVAAWNITFYDGGMGPQVADAVYGTFQDNEFAPDVILLQEMTSSGAVNALVGHLNAAPSSPKDWASATTFVNSGLNTAMVYRASRLDVVEETIVSAGGAAPRHPRNVVRYDMRPVGYDSDTAIISFYPTHMKAGSTADDQNRRTVEAVELSGDAQDLPPGRPYILGGDFNTQSASQFSYQVVNGFVYNTGPFLDPITAGGDWQNNSAFRFIHTQDPATQMDDRYDIILVSPTLVDGAGWEYVGEFGAPWDLSRWDDPNHSYRAWGNDGTTYNARLRTTGNAHVHPATAQALIDLSSGGGHIPVFLDLRLPALTSVPAALDFGDVPFGSQPTLDLPIASAVEVSRWGPTGAEATEATILAGPGIAAPAGSLVANPGGEPANAAVTLTQTDIVGGGPVETYLDVLSNDVGRATIRVPVYARVVGCNSADADVNGVLNVDDIDMFVASFLAGDHAADLDGNGTINLDDIDAFVTAFFMGCNP